MRPAYQDHQGCDHGHVYPNPDGAKKACGGPRHCKACRDDLVALYEAGAHGASVLQHQYIDPFNVTAQLLEAMKGQMLIVLVNRLGGKVDIPVDEVDGTGAYMLAMHPDLERRIFTFEVEKKS